MWDHKIIATSKLKFETIARHAFQNRVGKQSRDGFETLENSHHPSLNVQIFIAKKAVVSIAKIPHFYDISPIFSSYVLLPLL